MNKPDGPESTPISKAAGRDGPGTERPVRTSTGEYQERNELGHFIPRPVYELVPCFWCLASAAREGDPLGAFDCDDCHGTLYVRRDPERHPIAREHRAQEKPA